MQGLIWWELVSRIQIGIIVLKAPGCLLGGSQEAAGPTCTFRFLRTVLLLLAASHDEAKLSAVPGYSATNCRIRIITLTSGILLPRERERKSRPVMHRFIISGFYRLHNMENLSKILAVDDKAWSMLGNDFFLRGCCHRVVDVVLAVDAA